MTLKTKKDCYVPCVLMVICVVFVGVGREGVSSVLVTEFRGMALNGLFCADLRPFDQAPSLTLLTIPPVDYVKAFVRVGMRHCLRCWNR